MEEKTSIRPSMVASAKSFLSNPRVLKTPIEHQRNFLRNKGLTEEEIDKAFSILDYDASNSSGSDSRLNAIPRIFKGVVVLGAVTCFAYRFVRNWSVPNLLQNYLPSVERIEKMEDEVSNLRISVMNVSENISLAFQKLAEQNESINRTLILISNSLACREKSIENLQSDVNEMKSLMTRENRRIQEEEFLSNDILTVTNSNIFHSRNDVFGKPDTSV